MGTKAKGRGVAAAFGLLLVLAGIAGAVVLWVMADRRPEQAVEGFARGPVGCTTTLEFSDTGTFFVFEERVGTETDAFDECEPVASPEGAFGVELVDGEIVALTRAETSISYDTADAVGQSILQLEIVEAGRFELVVEGPDPSVVAAVGRDPDQGVAELRSGAAVVGVLGVLLGSLLLLVSGRRSKRAASYGPPESPGWGPQPQPVTAWPPEPPRLVVQQPINPMLPPESAVAPESPPEAEEPVTSPWAPPSADGRRDPPPPA